MGRCRFHSRRVRAGAAAVSTLELRFGELRGCPIQLGILKDKWVGTESAYFLKFIPSS